MFQGNSRTVHMAQAKGRKPWPGKPFGTQSINESRAEVVAQLVEWLLPTPEIHSSNPNISKVLSTNCNLNRKDENKEKETGNGPFLKENIQLQNPFCDSSKKKDKAWLLLGFKLRTFRSIVQRSSTLASNSAQRLAFELGLQQSRTKN